MRLNSIFFIFFLIYSNLGFTQRNYQEQASSDIQLKNINYYLKRIEIDGYAIKDSIFTTNYSNTFNNYKTQYKVNMIWVESTTNDMDLYNDEIIKFFGEQFKYEMNTYYFSIINRLNCIDKEFKKQIRKDFAALGFIRWYYFHSHKAFVKFVEKNMH